MGAFCAESGKPNEFCNVWTIATLFVGAKGFLNTLFGVCCSYIINMLQQLIVLCNRFLEAYNSTCGRCKDTEYIRVRKEQGFIFLELDIGDEPLIANILKKALL